MIKTCPFCGEKASIFQSGKQWRIECVAMKCDVQGPVASTSEEALQLWNQPSGLSRIAERIGLDQPCIEMILFELDEYGSRLASARHMIGKLQAQVQKLRSETLCGLMDGDDMMETVPVKEAD